MNSTATPSTTARFARLDRNATVVIATLLAISALLVVPFLAMAPTESASTEPTGDVFTARDRVDDTFVSSVHASFYIVDHDGDDLLRAEPLRGLLAAQDALRTDDDQLTSAFATLCFVTGGTGSGGSGGDGSCFLGELTPPTVTASIGLIQGARGFNRRPPRRQNAAPARRPPWVSGAQWSASGAAAR